MGFLRETFGIGKRVEPLEGTNISLFNSIIPSWWAENGLTSGAWFPGNAALADRVWVANRCIQLNSQQIASMPLEWSGAGTEPAWVANPDPSWFPNGVADALFSLVASMYGWGFALIHVTARYADGFPQFWMPLDSSLVSMKVVNGARQFKYGETILDPRDVVQIDRNPSTALHGTSALRSYAQQAWGLLAAGNQSMNVNQGGIPTSILKSSRKLTEEQATSLAAKWDQATAARAGTRVLPPELEFEAVSFNPADLALLDTQEFNAKAIATAFGVPSVLLNMALQGGLTYQNPAMLGEMWWRFELRPTATRIANALSAQMLPRGQWVSFDAADTFAPLTDLSDDDDPQLSQVANASPAQQPTRLTAVTGG